MSDHRLALLPLARRHVRRPLTVERGVAALVRLVVAALLLGLLAAGGGIALTEGLR